MTIRVKSKRRLIVVAAAGFLSLAVGAAAYALRSSQVRKRLEISRTEGVAALSAGRYEEALHKIGSYVQRNGEDAEALYQYAQARERVPEPNAKHIAQAIAFYRQVLNLEPGRHPARRRLLSLYVDYGMNAEALDAAAALTSPDDQLAVLRAKARVLARQQRFNEAVSFSEEYNRLQPADLEMQRLTLEIMLAGGDPATKCVEHAERLRVANPDDARFELLLGIAHRMGAAPSPGQSPERSAAKAWLTKAASRTSVKDPVFVTMLVEQLEGLELFSESVRVLAEAADVDAAGNERPYVKRLWQAKRFEEVAARLAGLDPADKSVDAELLALRAAALFELGRAGEAAPIVDAIGRRFDSPAEAWARVLKTLFAPAAVGKRAPNKDVLRACFDAADRLPRNPYFRHFLADALAAAGEEDLAITNWKQAMQLAPAWAAPRVKLAEMALRAGQPVAAAELALEARSRDADDADVSVVLCRALAAILVSPQPPGGDPDRARWAQQLREEVSRAAGRWPDAEQTVLLRTLLQAVEGSREHAAEALAGALAAPLPLSEGTYLGLVVVNATFGLNMEDACHVAWERALRRVTPALAASRARVAGARKAGDAYEILEAAKRTAADSAELTQLRAASASVLDAMNDPRARRAWMSLAQDAPEDALVQLRALGSRSVRDDRDFLDQTIERLRAATAETAVNWRLARARWILDGASDGDTQALVRAATLLGDLSREYPGLSEPRLLLSRCLVRLRNVREAIDQLDAVVRSNPQHLPACIEVADLLQAQGDYAGARPYLDRVLADDSASGQHTVAAARMLARGGEVAAALVALERAATADPTKSAGFIMLAGLHRQQGNVGKAESMCRALLAKSVDPAAVALLADILASQGRTEECERVLSQLDTGVASPQKELVRGRHYAAYGQPARAIEQFTAATQAAPGDPLAWRLLAKVHLAAAALPEALAVAGRVAGITALQPVEHQRFQRMQRCAKLLPPGDAGNALIPLLAAVLDEAAHEQAVADALRCVGQTGGSAGAAVVDAVRDVAKKNPRCLAVQMLAARLCVASGGPGTEQAVALCTEAMRQFPNEAEPAQVATAALQSLGRWSEALATARQWGQQAPSVGAALSVAKCHLALGNAQEAISAVKPYVPLGDVPANETPVTIEARLLYARSLCLLGRIGEAEALLSSRLAASAQYRVGWINLAAAMPDRAAAARWLDLADQRVPGSATAERAVLARSWLSLAGALGTAPDAERARDRAKRLIAAITAATLSDTRATADELVVAGALCEGVGDEASAEAAYRRALATNPQHPVAMNNLAMILVGRGDGAAAERLAADAVTHDHPRRASFFDTLATARTQMTKWKDAVEAIEMARRLNPNDVGFQIHEVAILYRSGQKTRADAAFEKLLDLRPEDRRLSNTDRDRLRLLRTEFGVR